MGFFRKLSKLRKLRSHRAAGGSDATEVQRELAVLDNDRRLHLRCQLQKGRLVTLKLSNGLVGDVRDLSYGGLAVRFDFTEQTVPVAPNGALPAEVNGELTILDRSIACRLALVRTFTTGTSLVAGFSIYHDSPKTLIFLREMIEPWRWSLTLASVGEEVRNEQYKGADWSYLRGEGPVDIVMRAGPDGKAVAALVTYRQSGRYAQVRYDAGKITTGQSAFGSLLAGSALMEPGREVDRLALRQVLYVLLNLPTAEREIAEPVLEAILAALGAPSVAARPPTAG